MTIRDRAARGRMEQSARPPSFGKAYYGPRLAGLGQRRAAGNVGIVAFAAGVLIAVAAVKIALVLFSR